MHGASNGSNPYDVADPVLSTIGNTPIVEYPEPLPGTIYCKLEHSNPTGSQKDRLALGLILEMRERGDLSEGDLIVAPSSGNMGGSLALAANRLGHDAVITAPASSSPQKIGYVKALGAELITCPDVPPDHDDHYQNSAGRVAESRGGVLVTQYENPLNWKVHRNWTGPELWRQIDTGELGEVTHVVSQMSSGGTISGVGSAIKERTSAITIVGVDARRSNISRDFHGEPRVEYDTVIEGLGQHRTTPSSALEYVDEVVSVEDAVAIAQTRAASRGHGVLMGPASGASLSVARDIATGDGDATVVTFVMDGYDQYFELLNDGDG